MGQNYNGFLSLETALKKFRLPLCHRGAEKIIRKTLELSSSISLTDDHVRQAVIATCLTPLRQNIGSCFATAPAILIHEEQQERFVADLYEMLTTGRLKRVIAGVEFSVPMCLNANTLLKSWEYTLASFSEVKMEFSRWNLYTSLGLHPAEKGGIGELLYKKLEKKLQEVNEKTSKFYLEYSPDFGDF
jgi:hypothetical protein